MARMMRKKTRNILITVGGAAGASWLVRTFRGGDSLMGLIWGSLWGNPLLGLVVGAVTPNRVDGQTNNARRKFTVPEGAEARIEIGDYAVLARMYRKQASDASATGNNDLAREYMAKAEAAEATA